MQKILLAVAVLSGLFLAYVDSRPRWDDTGITVGALLLTTGLISLLGYQRPWLLALAAGAWLPLWESLTSHNFGSIIALVIAFTGAYAGWVLRLVLQKSMRMI